MKVPRVVRASLGNARHRSYSPSTRRHGLSVRQNVLRRIHITIVVPAALGAVPFPGCQRQFLQILPAVKAPPARRVEPVRQPQFPPVPPALVLHHPPEFAEPRVQDRAGKGVVLDHAAHVQVLEGNHVKATNEVGGGLVQVVPSGVGDAGVEPGDLEPVDCPSFGRGRAVVPAGKKAEGSRSSRRSRAWRAP